MLKEVIEGTMVAEFDMCRVGLMRDPVNQLLDKKGMEITTTSQQFYYQSYGRKCNHQHEHQHVAGDTIYKGIRIKRTEFSEKYNRRFARTLAQALTKVTCSREAPMGFVFAASSSKRGNPKAMPAKRRRTTGKSSDVMSMSSLCEMICSQVLSMAPKVGRINITQPQILQDF